jgi:hypothetical protein
VPPRPWYNFDALCLGFSSLRSGRPQRFNGARKCVERSHRDCSAGRLIRAERAIGPPWARGRSQTVDVLAVDLQVVVTELRALVAEPVVHADETSIRAGTGLNWIHTISPSCTRCSLVTRHAGSTPSSPSGCSTTTAVSWCTTA